MEVGHFGINVYVFTYLVASKLCIKYVDSPGIKKRIDLCELIGYFIKLIIYEEAKYPDYLVSSWAFPHAG